VEVNIQIQRPPPPFAAAIPEDNRMKIASTSPYGAASNANWHGSDHGSDRPTAAF